MSSFSLETSTPMCTVSDFMLYYPCLEAEPGGLTPSRNAYTTVEPLDETRRWAELTRRVVPLDPKEPRRRRPVRERPFRAGRSVRTLVRLNSSIVYHIPIRQDPAEPLILLAQIAICPESRPPLPRLRLPRRNPPSPAPRQLLSRPRAAPHIHICHRNAGDPFIDQIECKTRMAKRRNPPLGSL